MTLRELCKTITCDCYICIYGYTEKYEEITLFDNRPHSKLGIALKDIFPKHWGDKVKAITAGSDTMYIEIDI